MLITNITLYGWDKKPRTMIRYIKGGDIFCFKVNEITFCFGYILTKVAIGHVARLLNLFSNANSITKNEFLTAKKIEPIVILDTYSLFDKRISGEWRIVGHAEGLCDGLENIFFSYGADGDKKKIDTMGNFFYISDKEAKSYLPYSPKNNVHILNMLKGLGYIENK